MTTKELPIGKNKVFLGADLSGQTKQLDLDKKTFNAGSTFTARERKQYEQARDEEFLKQQTARRKQVNANKSLSNKSGRAKPDYAEESRTLPVTKELVYAEPEVELISKEQLEKICPIKMSARALNLATDAINECIEGMDSIFKLHFRDNVIGLIDVLRDSTHRVSFNDYVKAVSFCTYKMAGNTDTRSYSLTFPDRIARMEKERLPMTHLHSYANAYARSKTVAEVMARMIVPTHVMYQDYFHLAVKTQVELMSDKNISSKVRSDAAHSLMTHLKTPEIKKAELNIGIKESEAVSELRNALSLLSNAQRDKVINGQFTVSDISATTFEIVEDEDTDIEDAEIEEL